MIPICPHGNHEIIGGCKECEMEQMENNIILNENIITKWISVKDKLPKDKTQVIVFLDGKTQTEFDTAFINNGEWYDDLGVPYPNQKLVTHWILPNPPNTK